MTGNNKCGATQLPVSQRLHLRASSLPAPHLLTHTQNASASQNNQALDLSNLGSCPAAGLAWTSTDPVPEGLKLLPQEAAARSQGKAGLKLCAPLKVTVSYSSHRINFFIPERFCTLTPLDEQEPGVGFAKTVKDENTQTGN